MTVSNEEKERVIFKQTPTKVIPYIPFIKGNIDILKNGVSELEKISLENMLFTYMKELMAIDENPFNSKLIPIGVRRKMWKYGIWSYVPRIDHRPGFRICLNQKGKDLIKKIIEDAKR